VCWSFGVVGLEWYPYCRLQVIQQSSRKLLMMDILMSETCWAHKKWNKIVSDIKLAFYSSTITMMHGPINIRFSYVNVYHTILSRSISCLMPLYFTPFRLNASSKPNPFIRLLFFLRLNVIWQAAHLLRIYGRRSKLTFVNNCYIKFACTYIKLLAIRILKILIK